jgi:hypothetical protein
LTSARADLVLLYAELFRKHNAARTALWIATHGKIDSDTSIGSGLSGPPITIAQLSDFVRRCEVEEAQTRKLLARVDARLAEVSGAALGYEH